METFDWQPIKYFESISNIKSGIHDSRGKTPNTKTANGIVVCLQQGRMFFQSAINSPLEIKPLSTFYGMVGFAKALILAKHFRKIESLKSSHGLKDISSEDSKIRDLQLKILSVGTFQEFNDVVCHTGGVLLIDGYNDEYVLGDNFDKSSGLNDIQISLKEILSRLPGLRTEYKETFKENAKIINFRLEYEMISGLTDIKITMYSNPIFYEIGSLKQFVSELRHNYPFLEKWCFLDVAQDPIGSVFTFCNLDKKGIDEFSGQFETPLIFISDLYWHLRGRETHYNQGEKVIKLNPIKFNPTENAKLELHKILPPIINIGSSLEPDLLVTQPKGASYLSAYSLHYLGMFLLSSLVRYRPQIWVNAISKTPIGNSIVDDTALSLIEKFVDYTLSEFPKMVVEEIKTPN